MEEKEIKEIVKEFFFDSKTESLKDFIASEKEDIHITAYEVTSNKSIIGNHISLEFLKDHLNLFDDMGFYETYDDEILFDDERGYEYIRKVKEFAVIIKEDKVGEFNGYSMYI